MNCSNLTEAQRRSLKEIPLILRMAINNQTYLAAIMAKMDEMNRPQPPVTNNVAPGGFATSGGTLVNPTVNNFGPPLANLTFTEEVTQALSSDGTGVKEMKLHIKTDRPIPGAVVGVVMSGPINLTQEYFTAHPPSQEGAAISQINVGSPLSNSGVLIPNSFALIIGAPAALSPGVDLVVPVESKFDVHVVQVLQIRQ